MHFPPALGRRHLRQRLSADAIRAFAIGKVSWIRREQAKLREQDRETPREYLNRETHYLWGQRRLLRVEEVDAPPSVTARSGKLLMRVRPGTSAERRAQVLGAWYREELRAEITPLLQRWEKRLGVRSSGVYLQRMRTRWGSCSRTRDTIRFNTELAKKPQECLEYILVHELIHLIEPTHNENFVHLMDQYLPGWKARRELLNRLPIRHELWSY